MLPQQRHFECSTHTLVLFAIFMCVPDGEPVAYETKQLSILCLKTTQIADEVVSKESLRNMVQS